MSREKSKIIGYKRISELELCIPLLNNEGHLNDNLRVIHLIISCYQQCECGFTPETVRRFLRRTGLKASEENLEAAFRDQQRHSARHIYPSEAAWILGISEKLRRELNLTTIFGIGPDGKLIWPEEREKSSSALRRRRKRCDEGKAVPALNPTEVALLEALLAKPDATQRDLAAEIGKSPSSVHKQLNKLLAWRLVAKSDKRQGGAAYVLTSLGRAMLVAPDREEPHRDFWERPKARTNAEKTASKKVNKTPLRGATQGRQNPGLFTFSGGFSDENSNENQYDTDLRRQNSGQDIEANHLDSALHLGSAHDARESEPPLKGGARLLDENPDDADSAPSEPETYRLDFDAAMDAFGALTQSPDDSPQLDEAAPCHDLHRRAA